MLRHAGVRPRFTPSTARLAAWRRGDAVLALVGLGLAGSARLSGGRGQAGTGSKGNERRLVLFYTAEIHGAVEPCGCTSDPLGDISRLAAQVKRARQSGAAVALVDAGSMLYPEGAVSPRERPSADLRGRFIATELKRLGLVGAALGLTDTTGGREHIQPPRLASNMTNAPAGLVQPAHVEKLGPIALGVAGVVEPAVAQAVGASASDMEEAARRDVERLRQQGADIVVLLAPVDRNAARALARKSGADVVVMGKQVQQGLPRMEKVGRGFVVSPGDELQRVGRLEIVLRASARRRRRDRVGGRRGTGRKARPEGGDRPLAGAPSRGAGEVAGSQREAARRSRPGVRRGAATGGRRVGGRAPAFGRAVVTPGNRQLPAERAGAAAALAAP